MTRRWQRLGLALAALALLAGLDRAADLLATRQVLAELESGARATAGLHGAVLRAEIEKQRSLPVILAQDPDLVQTLRDPTPARLDALNRKLERLAAATRTGVLYALDPAGRSVAASNWRQEESFVGIDYAFRPYFGEAWAGRPAEHFALGTVSHRPGLYLSRRVEDAAGPVGVIVVKAEFNELEESWARLPEPALAVDARGIVTVTSIPDWHFRATLPLTPAQREEIRASLQFGDQPLRDLSFRTIPATRPALPGQPPLLRPQDGPSGPWLMVEEPVPGIDWRLSLLAPLRPALEPARATARLAALLLGLLGIFLVALARRRNRRITEGRARGEARRAALEAEVGLRTAELRAANDGLRAEAEERRRAEAAVHRMRDELGQANRLAILGQITASVAHEINQPLAAIRTFADNASLLVTRGETPAAAKAITTIAGLTERIGAITAGLRGFARKSTGEMRPEPIRGAIDGALLLLGHRLRQNSVAVVVTVEGDPAVRAERVRLEQVLVNLVQNAIEALGDRDDGRIAITASAGAGRVRVAVQDNGPGLDATVRAALFMPFTTTKSAGLGLGLVISRQIAADLGGTLEAPPPAAGSVGALFVLELEQAP
ncbi:ATP-binding protein [Roseomonas sp. 18066]|uniref:ATP-binding protein n=1 Tax=Roseomonas sp. 18066 TaxID=2681412 RepID=UPI001358EDB6|nr:ATP-binding protein [Roseomonas sp. 18066]